MNESNKINDLLENDKKLLNSEMLKLINKILERLDNIEKTYVSINADLINQNIKMSEILNGKLKEPHSPNIENNNNNNVIKELYFYELNNKVIVYGPGTFDNKPILKQYGEWNSFNKSWDLTLDLEILYEKFPNIIKKEK